MMQAKALGSERESYPVHPTKFNLWLFLVSVSMIFISLTSAYVVRRAEGNWLFFQLPQVFWYTTGIIVLSSVTLGLAYYFAKQDEIAKLKVSLWATLILGIAFLAGQTVGYQEMVGMDIFMSGNVSGSFFYIISGLHGVHVLGGIVYLIVLLVQTYQYKVHSKSMTGLNLGSTYWHFIGILWVYLYFFLYLFR